MTSSRPPVTPRPAHDAEGILQRIHDAYIVLDREYRFVYANHAAQRDMKLTLPELLGRVHWEVFPASHDITAGRRYREAAETKVPQHFTEHYRYEGYDIHMEMSAYPTESGGVAVFWRDVTARVKTEQRLRESEAEASARFAELELVYRYAPVALFTLDREYRFTHVNQRMALITRVPLSELVGRTLWDVAPTFADRLAERYRPVLERGESLVDMEVHIEAAGTPGAARDWLASSHPLRSASGEIIGLIVAALEVTERKAAERLLRLSEERYALAARATRNAIWDWELATGKVTWSGGLTDTFGYARGPADEHVEWWLAAIHPEDRARVAETLHAVTDGAGTGLEWQDTYRFRRADGSFAEVLDRGYVMRDAQGRPARMIGAMEDVTVRRQLEERLRQAQKMEAIGQLAGGVAHDFNNLLTVIAGNLEFVREDLPADHASQSDLAEIDAAAVRARALVRQLLTFGRKQPVQPRVVRVGEVVRGMERLLQRVIGEEIALEVAGDAGEPPVRIDVAQLEQVVMNLAVNARDAMLTACHGHAGTGGALSVEVGARELATEHSDRFGTIAPGRYVALVVRDSGHGMDEETRAHAFEPFFTTKEIGEGTGLGLATVHGVVQRAGGHIRVDSEPGQGTTFTIWLPAVEADEAGRIAGPTPPPASAHAGAATVLVVEDEKPVREIVRRILERHGYRVLEARHGADAMELWQRHRDRVDALVTDLRMPEVGGLALVAKLRADVPTLPVVYVSGYADQAPGAQAGPQDRFVEKPFTADALLDALCAVLAPVTPKRPEE